jgi:cellulose synthase/poly-beta-1,6-N-acetylglucosamine synthase-like glycosyltransferase
MLVFLLSALSVLLTLIAGATLVWMMHAWRRPDTYGRIWFAPPPQTLHHGFSIIVPCRDEPEEVMRPTIQALLGQSHPDLEVIISVGDDDEPTVATALLFAAEDPRVKVSINTDPVKNKPRQLNTALAMCTKDVVGIIDAESLTKPDLLVRVDATQAEGADVVQGAVHLMNYRDSWFALHNCMEYRAWFRSRLHGHADAGFIPLGGNTVFTRREVLDDVGGWDGDCLAEDCEIGVRLSSRHRKIVCAYDPDLVTEEQSPGSVRALVKQRTRWSLGFMQVLTKGEWKRLPRNRRFAAWLTLVQQHAMALAGIAFPIALLTALLVDLPVTATMIAFLPLVPMLTMIAFQCQILHEFGRDMQVEIPLRTYLLLIFTAPLYQVLLGWAAVRAVYKYARRDFGWYKTPHEAHAPERVEKQLALVGAGAALGGYTGYTDYTGGGAGSLATELSGAGALGSAVGDRPGTRGPAGPPAPVAWPPGAANNGAGPAVDNGEGADRTRMPARGPVTSGATVGTLTAGRDPGRRGRIRRELTGPVGKLKWGSFAAVLLAVAVVNTLNLAQYPAFFDDEGTYFSQAWAIQELGQLSPYTYWYDHPPMGWIQLSAFTWLTDPLFGGNAALLSGRVVMVGYGLVTAVLIFVLARRLGLRHGYALLAMGLWGLSPLVGLEMRQIFLDNIALPWLIAAFVFMTSRRQDLWHYCAAGLCFGVAVLSKETFLIAAPGLVVALWHYGFRPTRVFGLVGFSMFTMLAGTGYVLLAALKNELLPGADRVSLWDALVFQLGARAGSGSVLSAGTEANGYLHNWLETDAVLIVAGLVAAVVCLFLPAIRSIVVTIAVFTLMALRPGGYLPGMYVIVLLPFFAIAIAAVLDRLHTLVTSSERPGRRTIGVGAIAVLLGAAAFAVASGWLDRTGTALTAHTNLAHDQAVDWAGENLDKQSLIVSDNTYWNDLVNAGWDPGWDGAVWFYKVDLDPAFVTEHPEGWRSIDYLVWNSTISGNSNAIPLVRQAYEHSVLLQTFGEGPDTVEIREVVTS